MTASAYRSKLERARGRLDVALTERGRLRTELVALEENALALERATTLAQNVAKDTQSQLVLHLSDIVQLALDATFPDVYEFRIEFEIKRGRTEAKIGLLDRRIPGAELVDPMDATGGGVVDVLAFALRIAAWTLGKTNDVVILDEPFRFLSRDLAPKAGAILAALSERLRLQFIVVTHSDALIDVADRVFEVSKDGTVSKVVVREGGKNGS